MRGPEVQGAAQRVNDSPAAGVLARLGYAASGVLHILLGVIAIRVAWFHAPTPADQSGAFGTLAQNPLGRVALWVLAVGFAGLAVWQVTAALGNQSRTSDRVKAAAKAVLYVAMAWTSVRFALGDPSSTKDQSQDFTATLVAQPAGRIAVGAVGIGVVVIGGYHVYKGWSRAFLRDLADEPGRFVTAAGRLGYVAKGIALAVVGVLFVVAAATARPDQAGGLDTGLRTLAEQPFGGVLLTVVAVGLVAFGVYSFGRARWART